jgi:hypothetical protein
MFQKFSQSTEGFEVEMYRLIGIYERNLNLTERRSRSNVAAKPDNILAVRSHPHHTSHITHLASVDFPLEELLTFVTGPYPTVRWIRRSLIAGRLKWLSPRGSAASAAVRASPVLPVPKCSFR